MTFHYDDRAAQRLEHQAEPPYDPRDLDEPTSVLDHPDAGELRYPEWMERDPISGDVPELPTSAELADVRAALDAGPCEHSVIGWCSICEGVAE